MRGVRLQRCPFCGKKVTMASMSDGDEHWFYILGGYRGNDRCHCRVFMESDKYRDGATEKEIMAVRAALVEKWNRRVNE